jgi:Zn-dependent protease with chaperone function
MIANGKRLPRTVSLIAAAALLVPAVILAVERVTFQPGFNLYSPQVDIDLGRQNSAEADKQLRLIKDPEVTDYVSRLGKELVRHEPLPADYPWTFKVVDSREINAFAFPGGFIYVNRGAIEAAEDEAQLAGVLAHESGHVVMRHGTHMATQMVIAQGGLALLGSLLGQSSGVLTDFTKLGISFGVSSILLHNSRGAESQADEVGAYVLYHAGYDPHAMAQFFQIIEKKYPQRTIQFFSDHPVPENRIKDVDAEIPQLGPPLPDGGKTDSPEFEAVKKKLLAMPPPKVSPAPPQAKQGANPSLTDVMPSGNFKRCDQNAFSISYPDNWRVYGGSGTSVTLAPEAGVSENAVSYGVIIISGRTAGGTTSLEASLQQLINDQRKQNPDLKITGPFQKMRVNGVAAEAADLDGLSPLSDASGKPLAERDRLVTMKSPNGSLLTLIFIAPERDYSRLEPAFNRMLDSLQVH